MDLRAKRLGSTWHSGQSDSRGSGERVIAALASVFILCRHLMLYIVKVYDGLMGEEGNYNSRGSDSVEGISCGGVSSEGASGHALAASKHTFSTASSVESPEWNAWTI